MKVKLGGRLYLLTFNECLLFKRAGGFVENEIRKHNKEILVIQLSQQKRRHSKLILTCESLNVVGDVCYKCKKTMRHQAAKPPVKKVFRFEQMGLRV